MKKKIKKRYIIIPCVLIILLTIPYIGVAIAHACVFSRADYDKYDSNYYVTYEDVELGTYAREELQISSGDNMLAGYLYGEENSLGLIVLSPGHRDPNDIKLYEIMYFVDQGWSVLCYDYTGCYNSEGRNMVGYTQSVYDLDAVLTYVESEERFAEKPLLLFGHSLGAYASAAVLQYNHKVDAAIIASGFDEPKEQWKYSIERYTGIFGRWMSNYAGLYMDINFGEDSYISAVDGINSEDIPVLVISGTVDKYYGNERPIYLKQDLITNPKCEFLLMEEDNHNGHYDYFLTEEAIKYTDKIQEGDTINKWLYKEHNEQFMNQLNSFYLEGLKK